MKYISTIMFSILFIISIYDGINSQNIYLKMGFYFIGIVCFISAIIFYKLFKNW